MQGQKAWHERRVFELAALPPDTKYRPKDLQSLCNTGAARWHAYAKVCVSLECT